MATRTVTITAATGLHARPAGELAKAVAACGLAVTIGRHGGPAVDAGSILAVMSLGAGSGDELELAAEGTGAEQVLDELVTILRAQD